MDMFPDYTLAGSPQEWINLYSDLKGKLFIEEKRENLLVTIKICLTLCREAIDSLKHFIHTYTFQTSEEEIYFFKEVKPAYYSQLIYYLKLFNIEAARPRADTKLWETCLNRIIERLQYYFDSNIEFYQYYKSGDTYLDETYFKRGIQDSFLQLDDYYFSYDASFSTSHDLKVARLLANERIHLYVSNCLKELNMPENGKSNTPGIPLTWTATKAGLIELLYALQSTGTFNEGAADLKGLATYFEKAFHVQLGNYYNVFQEMRIRKKNRTHFLDQLRDRLIRRMDEADEKL